MADLANNKKVKDRSVAYPGFTLEKVIEFTQTLRKNLGSTSFSRESAAQALGHSNLSGSATVKTAACVHFGMLTREGNTYRQSDLSEQYFNYTSEEERCDALKQAIQKPTLYNKLLNDFNGKSLPAMLDNVLIRKYGITEKVGNDVAKNFRLSAEFAGVLANGVINIDIFRELFDGDCETIDSVNQSPDLGRNPSTKNLPLSVSSDMLPVKIPGTDVIITFPISYAYDLSVGAFKDGIESLEASIKKNKTMALEDAESNHSSEN